MHLKFWLILLDYIIKPCTKNAHWWQTVKDSLEKYHESLQLTAVLPVGRKCGRITQKDPNFECQKNF